MVKALAMHVLDTEANDDQTETEVYYPGYYKDDIHFLSIH